MRQAFTASILQDKATCRTGHLQPQPASSAHKIVQCAVSCSEKFLLTLSPIKKRGAFSLNVN
jgi:hypothetical protein